MSFSLVFFSSLSLLFVFMFFYSLEETESHMSREGKGANHCMVIQVFPLFFVIVLRTLPFHKSLDIR